MGKITSGLLPASDPIFREGISRSHPLLEKRKRLLREARAAATETDTPEAEDAASKRGPPSPQK
jgi:hypothetical protein